jgi:SAM-dependent methyltransferase
MTNTDVFGQALSDFYYQRPSEVLWLHNDYGEAEEMPVDVFFREQSDMPDLELNALAWCSGRILDVGAGVGSHTLVLEKRGKSVTAIDICEEAVQLMKARGVKNALHQDFYTVEEKFDTLLLLMNGIGICGTLAGLEKFLAKASDLLLPGGQIIFDSSDVSYLYDEQEKTSKPYFGEVKFCYEYKKQKGDWFNWVYIDQQTLKDISKKLGWRFKLLYQDEQDQYLARLSK